MSKWEVYRDASGRLYVAGDTTGPIAWVNEDDVAQDGMSNADLIAAAPDLLEALNEMQMWVCAFALGKGRNALEEVLKSPRMQKARAAIFKASGQ